MKKKKVLFIINPKSGTGRYRKVPSRIEAFLDKESFDYELCYTRYGGHATELARKAVEDHTDMVVSVGGDGTLNEVIRALAGTQTALGILPTGSGNGLAHHLHIPFKIKKAVRLLNEGCIENIDTVSLNGQVYASIAGVGFDAFVAEKYRHTAHRGFFPYLRLVISNYFRYQPRTYVMEGDGETHTVKALLISFANSSQWGYDVKISPKASVQDGVVDVMAVRKPPLYALPRIVLFLLSGNLDRITKYVKIYKIQQFKLKAAEGAELYTHLDGDFMGMQREVEVKVLPMSLRIALKRTI
ncbi:MAG: diacylglycerol kinase family lipid kinase [Bacteroidales bacterium]|nr:diacylglycerol kinase family lipid kinase [Bacteroidales bacterium]